MFTITILPNYVLIRQHEYSVKLRDSDFKTIITNSTSEHVDLNDQLTFFRRPSGNVTFVFFERNDLGFRTPTLQRIDINGTIWQDLINKRTFLEAPYTKDGLCVSCGSKCTLSVHYNCAKYDKILEMFLDTCDGKTCVYMLTKILAHLYTSSKTCHIDNIDLDLLMHLNMDVSHGIFCGIYDRLINRKNHAFENARNFTYFIKNCGPRICDLTLAILKNDL